MSVRSSCPFFNIDFIRNSMHMNPIRLHSKRKNKKRLHHVVQIFLCICLIPSLMMVNYRVRNLF